MNAIGLIFAFVASALIFTLPKRWVVIPFLMGTLYFTRDAILVIGPAHFTLVQILVLIGILRAMMNGERIANGMNRVDLFLILWSIWFVGSSIFHSSEALISRLGSILIHFGSYFLFRIFIQDSEDVQRIFKVLCFVMVPVAILMILEKNTGVNFYGVFEGVTERVDFRHGHYRARGPFAHAILAGTVGATCFPMALYLWKKSRKYALSGLFATTGIVLASTSSGPVMMVFFTLFGLVLWMVRDYLHLIRWGAITVIIALDIIMTDPAYFLMARIDISGGSQGWFRARLIQSSIEHLDEWWLTGTDYTRHWMSSGITANALVTDITNHFLWMGVMGGLPLMILFIMVLYSAFDIAGRAIRENVVASTEHQFLIWTLGAILFGHIWNFFTITLFDQSIVYFYLILSCIGAIQAEKERSFANVATKQLVGKMMQSRYIRVEANNSFNNLCEAVPLNTYLPIQSRIKCRANKFTFPESITKFTQL